MVELGWLAGRCSLLGFLVEMNCPLKHYCKQDKTHIALRPSFQGEHCVLYDIFLDKYPFHEILPAIFPTHFQPLNCSLGTIF